jgi:methionyl-tRNA synthetase
MKFYITTPLYYVNASPHIGHSYTNIAADCLARYMRANLGEKNVYFLTGTDEHGQKVQKAAEEKGLNPQEFSDRMVFNFKRLWQALDISYNDFIRTTEARHIRMVERVLEILYQKQDIYLAEYKGWYCTPCETFWRQSQIKENPCCPDCKRPIEKISETNFFFRLSKYQDWLSRYIKDNPTFIRPEIRRHEVLSFLTMSRLTDLCISRPRERLSWGISFPFSHQHITYVWFDALINYISAVGEFDRRGRYVSQWWPADLHLIGKDILRQHAIYWPIILKALEIEPPRTIMAHGWWLLGEMKMSKSRGNVVDPLEICKQFGTDVYRYFLLRDVPFGLDGNFSQTAIIRRLNSDLANDLGNLVYRVLSMAQKYFAGQIPSRARVDSNYAKEILKKIGELPGQISLCLSAAYDYNFAAALGKIWELINMANKYIEDSKPWILYKENKVVQLKEFISVLIEVIEKTAEAISAFMPHTAVSIKEQLGAGTIKKGKPLFPRIDTSVN